MSARLKLYAVDLGRFRSMLGSGEEKFCAKVLRSVPPSVEQLGLGKEWRRGVTGLVLGEPGGSMSERSPAEQGMKADPGLSLAFASVIEAFARDGLGGTLPIVPPFCRELLDRPLFGLEAGGDLVRWGWLSGDETVPRSAHPLLTPIWVERLAVIGLSGRGWADEDPGKSREG